MEKKPLLGTNICTQVGILVKDIEKTSADYAEFFGVDVPPICWTGEYDEAHTEYQGKPSPARCRNSFFRIGDHIEIELIQPDEDPNSTWYHDLMQNGEGVHHLAFNVTDGEEKIKALADQGMQVIQRGRWPTGHYIYIDSKDRLKFTLELLENGKFEI